MAEMLGKESADKYRQFVFDVLGDNECWVDCGDDIFTTSVLKTFAKKNFDFFQYDPETKLMCVRPTMEMHKTTYNNMESLPNESYTLDLLEHGTGDVIIIYLCDFGHVVETIGESTIDDFMKQYPNSISLLI